MRGYLSCHSPPGMNAMKSILTLMLALSIGMFLSPQRTLAAPADVAREELPPTKVSQKIDQLLFASWAEHKITPSGIVDDATFLRRAMLDIIGRIPTPRERRAFTMEPSADKRRRLVQRLLHSPEFPRYWSQVWTHWFLTRAVDPVNQERLRGWLENEFAQQTSHRELAFKLITATGKARTNGSVVFLAEGRGTSIPAPQQQNEGRYDMVPATSRAARVFLGIDISCVQCHDHPFDPALKQKHFWGLNGFFRQADVVDARPEAARRAGGAPEWVLTEDGELNRNAMIFWGNRRGVVLATRPTYIDGKKYDARFPATRREQLAHYIVNDPQFVRAYVNRMWTQFFGRSLTQNPVVDDFGTHNEVVHQELLDTLVREFVTAKYDPRALIGWLCSTEAYQRVCAANASNADPELDVYFSRKVPKPMSPEQLLASSLVAARGKPVPGERDRLWQRWATRFAADAAETGPRPSCVDQHGSFEPLPSTLMSLLNDREFAWDHEWRGREPDTVIGEIYLAVLNRHPQPEERDNLARELEEHGEQVGKNLRPFYQDLFWALSNSNEFFFNH
jgi:hypothetical protein